MMGTREYSRVLKSWGFWENGLEVAVGREREREGEDGGKKKKRFKTGLITFIETQI